MNLEQLKELLVQQMPQERRDFLSYPDHYTNLLRVAELISPDVWKQASGVIFDLVDNIGARPDYSGADFANACEQAGVVDLESDDIFYLIEPIVRNIVVRS